MHSWFARMERLSASPGTMAVTFRNLGNVDVRGLLSRVTAPTLVLHRTDDRLLDVRHSRYLAEHIPGARLVELPGVDNMPSVGDADALVDEIETFLTGGRRAREPERALLTVLFTDIVAGTRRVFEIGDARWRDLLAAHDAAVRRQLAIGGGREIKTIGDGFLATFEGPPSAAVRCARAIVAATAELGVEIRAGLHTGECELIGDDVGGMAVHVAARVADLAQSGEVLVSSTLRQAVAGSGVRFEPRGQHELRGVPGTWPLYAAAA
jgi:class 3 adenylate cyclase